MPAAPVAVKSIVSTCLADEVAKHYGVECRNVLTGFKYIGEQIHLLEEGVEEARLSLALKRATVTWQAHMCAIKTPLWPAC